MAGANPRPPYAAPLPGKGWQLALWVQPGAKKNEILGEYQGLLRVKVAAPAVENKANRALEEFLAAKLGLRAGKASVISGGASRNKRLLLEVEEEPCWAGLNKSPER